ncbi:proprotein convertase subtilisin/kexin type 1 inhibitor, like isoform X1 [Synchiropus splendidus]|uniref:proprotein convertase subtilisin/kexin type 1 inhibitor, like isoform X1 n=1 Tax=Synchiropus splendidus TaxID=270530 RepID=UPI00237DEEB9|nr:proprotein convertase subtilisin/kexin type 1 inhibitor, like isoform X1 [Synchiropus splendidus]
MASLCVLLFSTAVIRVAQSLPAARGGGSGLDISVGGTRHQLRDPHQLLPYENRMMSYPALLDEGGPTDLYYDADGWRERGLEQALLRLLEKDRRRSLEEEQSAYLAALLRLLDRAQRAGVVDVVEEEEEDQGPAGDFKAAVYSDYDETGRVRRMERPVPAWWGWMDPRQVRELLESRVDPSQLGRVESQRLQMAGEDRRDLSGADQQEEEEVLRRLVAKILSSPEEVTLALSNRRRRDLSEAVASVGHRRQRRSLEDQSPAGPSEAPALLRVKRVEDDQELAPPAGLQRMKRLESMAAIAALEELQQGSQRRRRRDVARHLPPHILVRG